MALTLIVTKLIGGFIYKIVIKSSNKLQIVQNLEITERWTLHQNVRRPVGFQKNVIKTSFLAILAIFGVYIIKLHQFNPFKRIMETNDISYLVGNLTRIMIDVLH